MFYIVETTEQLNKLFEKGYDRVFIEPIYFNDNIHPALNHIALIYIKPLNNDKGYILNINHTEALHLDKTPINRLFNTFNEIYLRDRKSFIYFFPLTNTVDISFCTPEYVEPTTPAHSFFYTKYEDKENINILIPLVKHYEKCELIYDKIKEYCVKSDNNKFLNKLTTTFFSIERNGLKIDKYEFDKHFEPNNEVYFIHSNTVYSKYNLYTTTRRPSNSFNGINFAALGKDNGCRKSFVPKNDKFIEIDISAYHPTLAAQLVGYDFGSETPYEYFAKEADIDINEAKILMFRQLYGGIYKEYQYIEYFQLIQEHVNKIWNDFTSNGSIECPISGHKFTTDLKDINPQKLFNYTLQNLETSTNVCIVWDVIKLLKGKSTKIVLYTYDSILLDYNDEDEVLEDIKNVFKKYKLKIKLTQGYNYGKMVPLQ
jgi:hypothetical protein